MNINEATYTTRLHEPCFQVKSLVLRKVLPGGQ